MNSFLSFLALSSIQHSPSTENNLLQLLYTNLPKSFSVIAFNATLFIIILWPIANHPLLIGWYTLLIGVTLVRFLDSRSFIHRQQRHNIKTWQKHITIGVILSAVLWGSSSLLFFPADNVIYQMFISVMLIGMSAGALTTLAADLKLSHIYLYFLLIPLAFKFVSQDGIVYTSLFVLTILFIGLVSNVLRQFHTALIATHETLSLYKNSQAHLIESENRLRMVFDHTPAGIFYYDTDLQLIDCNQAFSTLLSTDKEHLIGVDINTLEDQSIIPTIRDALTSGIQIHEGMYHAQISGKVLWSKLQCVPISNSSGKVIGGVGMVADKTKEHEAMRQAEFFALHDPLTMLPNRKLLKDRIERVLKEEQRVHHCSALLFLDLDRFKQVNDSFGHAIGDKLLIETAMRLDNLLRDSDTLSRLGGDEFVILLPFLANTEEATIHVTRQIAEKIHLTLREPYQLDNHTLYSSSSIGAVIMNSLSDNTEEILRRADIAMYQAKEKGRNLTRFYDPIMDHEAKSYIRMQHSLHHAIEKNELELNFQPIVRIDTNAVCAGEVLLRWKHEKRGYISPAEFIPVAEESTVIKDIGQWVIEHTCQQIAQWHRNGKFNINYLTVNVSSKQLYDPDFAVFILHIIKQYGVDPTWIKLEITETGLIENFERTKKVIDQLNSEGIEFIIDDFGTGYSSLSYLKNLPFSTLKIDRAFIQDLLTNSDNEALMRAIIDIANQFGYATVAEGVETEEQRKKLAATDEGIYYQGYLYSKPVTAKDFEKFLLIAADE